MTKLAHRRMAVVAGLAAVALIGLLRNGFRPAKFASKERRGLMRVGPLPATWARSILAPLSGSPSLGPSPSGRSGLLSLLLRAIRAVAGAPSWFGEDPPKRLDRLISVTP